MIGVMPKAVQVDAATRRARLAVGALFLTNAVLYANVVPRLPEIRDSLGLTNAALGTAIAAMPTGALVAGWFAPVLIGRFGSARLASWGLVALAVATGSIPLAGSWGGLVAVFLVIGAVDSVVDVAQNSHGFRVQRRYGRSIVNTFHGMWSVGAVTGGSMGAIAAGLGIGLGVHLPVVAVVFAVLAIVAGRQLLAGPENSERVPSMSPGPVSDPPLAPEVLADPPRGGEWGGRRLPGSVSVWLLAGFGVLAVCGAVVEDAGGSWGAIYLRDELGAAPAVAGLGFVGLQAAMTVGRFAGDRIVDRWGQLQVVRLGGLLVVGGLGVALAVPTVATTVVGFAVAGLGVATVIPAAMHAADELDGPGPGIGLTAVSWSLRVGFLVSPPLVGAIADATSLRLALVGVPLAGIVIVLLAGLLREPEPRPT